jgi:DNA repair protein RadA/Sms
VAKSKVQYVCSSCDHTSAKWLGLCPSCGEWHTFEEKQQVKESSSKKHKVDISSDEENKPVRLTDVQFQNKDRESTNLNEFDRVLGGGLIRGSFLLLGGDPGIGKSTLMLQVAQRREEWTILYVAGEESASQIKQRASRIGLNGENLFVFSSTDIRAVIREARNKKSDLLVIDSIQTVFSSELSSLPGSVQQIRECSAMLQQLAKKEGVTTLMIGHVTKDGDIAGPKILEHMVDTVLHFEGDRGQIYRLLRGVKNRFGPAQEVGVFEMKNHGLSEVLNPSDLFLSDRNLSVSGNCVTCVMEGTRPILIEVQALVTPSSYSTPQRTANGFDQRRLQLLIAVLEKRAGYGFSGQDVYLNVAGGMKISDTAADLAVMKALASSLQDEPASQQTVYIGEVGLGGELRRIPLMEQRIQEADKMGFGQVVIPAGGTSAHSSLDLKRADTVSKAIRG